MPRPRNMRAVRNVSSYSASSFELFALSMMQEDIHTLRVRSGSVCESSVRLGHHDE